MCSSDLSELVLTTSNGNPVLDVDGREIRVTGGRNSALLRIGKDGTISYPDAKGQERSLNMRIGLWQFSNFGGLKRVGNTSFEITDASGPALNENTNNQLVKSSLAPGYLENSSVDVATEMVNLIIAQRAYEMNSKSITTTDEMMQTANQLKR